MDRPFPPQVLNDDLTITTVPSMELLEWVHHTFLDENSKLFNEEHLHLKDASLGFLWTAESNVRNMNRVVGQAEMPMFRCGKWQKARQEQQMRQWFGYIPDFLITLDAMYCAEAGDTEFCAVVDHELTHCAQALDAFGSPAFNKQTGAPKFAIKGHDVEEFVSMVRRYGVGAAAGKTAELVEAAKNAPTISRLNVSRACGTCNLKVA